MTIFDRIKGVFGKASSNERPAPVVQPAGNASAPVAAAPQNVPTALPPSGVSTALARVLRPQAAYRWILPQLAAITPQYIEMILRGALAGNHVQQWELFALMEDTWPRLNKNLDEIKNAVRGLKVSYTAYCEEDEEPTPEAEERCAVVSAALRNMRPDAAKDENSEQGTIFDILDAWAKGTSVLEIEWHQFDSAQHGSLIGPRATFWVHPVSYGWSNEGWLGLRADGNPSTGAGATGNSTVVEFPVDKFLVGICKARSGSALGGARLRALAWWWCAANFSADWLLNLAQVFGLPFRWANYDPNAPQATIDAICNMLQNMGSAGWAAFPAGTTLELKAEGQKSGKDTPQGDMLDRADKNCDLLILGQTLTTDSGGMGAGGGSLALGKVHEGVKGQIVTAAASFAAQVFNDQLIPSILRLNYGDDRLRARMSLETEEEEDLQVKATIVSTLAAAGAAHLIGDDYISSTFQIPKPAKGERTLADAAAEAAASAMENGKGKMEKGEGSGAGASKEAGAKDKADKEAPPVAAKMLERISGITDDALFAKALADFANTLETKS